LAVLGDETATKKSAGMVLSNKTAEISPLFYRFFGN
jgi:hypothetical protein